MQRPLLAELERRRFDLIVVGAGINGAGIARDAAMRGLRVLLLDKGDIARRHHQLVDPADPRRAALPGARRGRPRPRVAAGARAAAAQRPPPRQAAAAAASRSTRRNRGGPATDPRRHGRLRRALVRQVAPPPPHAHARDGAAARTRASSPTACAAPPSTTTPRPTFAERLAVENALSARDHGATVLTHARVDRLLVTRRPASAASRSPTCSSGRSLPRGPGRRQRRRAVGRSGPRRARTAPAPPADRRHQGQPPRRRSLPRRAARRPLLRGAARTAAPSSSSPGTGAT